EKRGEVSRAVRAPAAAGRGAARCGGATGGRPVHRGGASRDPERAGARDIRAVDDSDTGAPAGNHRAEPRAHENAEGVHDGSADLARGMAGGEGRPRRLAGRTREVSRRARWSVSLLLLALGLDGCSVFALPPAPSWVPLLGRSETGKVPASPPVPAAQQPTAPLISVGHAAPGES